MGRPAKPLRHYPNRVRAVREAKGLSLATVAKACRARPAISLSMLQKYETGELQLKVLHLEVIARALEVRPQQLLNSVDPVEDEQEVALLDAFRQLPEAERDRALKLLRALMPDPAGPTPRRAAS